MWKRRRKRIQDCRPELVAVNIFLDLRLRLDEFHEFAVWDQCWLSDCMAQIAAKLRQEKELMNSSSQNLRGYALLLSEATFAWFAIVNHTRFLEDWVSEATLARSVDLHCWIRNPTIGTFMNSPYYGTDGVPASLVFSFHLAIMHVPKWWFHLRFGTSGTIKENAAGSTKDGTLLSSWICCFGLFP